MPKKTNKDSKKKKKVEEEEKVEPEDEDEDVEFEDDESEKEDVRSEDEDEDEDVEYEDDEPEEEEEEEEDEDEEEEEDEDEEEEKPKKKSKSKKKMKDSKKGNSGEGIAQFAMIAGIVAAVFAVINIPVYFIPFLGAWCLGCLFGPVGGIAFVAGIALGIVALVIGPGKNKKKAFIGLALCGVTLFLWIVFIGIQILVAFVF